jgi:hypothetical protein
MGLDMSKLAVSNLLEEYWVCIEDFAKELGDLDSRNHHVFLRRDLDPPQIHCNNYCLSTPPPRLKP